MWCIFVMHKWKTLILSNLNKCLLKICHKLYIKICKNVWLTIMHHMKLISLKLWNPKRQKFYMQFKHINLKFRPKYIFLSVIVIFRSETVWYEENMSSLVQHLHSPAKKCCIPILSYKNNLFPYYQTHIQVWNIITSHGSSSRHQ